MRKRKRSFLHLLKGGVLLLLGTIVFSQLWALPAQARTRQGSLGNGYYVVMQDDADLLDQDEEEALMDLMDQITAYGNAAFKSIDYNSTTTENYIRQYYEEQFGSNSAIVFLIDMDNRNIWIHSNGAIYKTITTAYADTITDNVYKYASDQEYYICSYTAFDQALTLLRGQKIARPMKYASNLFLAVILALMINFLLVMGGSRKKKAGERQLLEGIRYQYRLSNKKAVYKNTTKVYSPPSSSGGGGSGGSSGGGGGGGGGGGHSF